MCYTMVSPYMAQGTCICCCISALTTGMYGCSMTDSKHVMFTHSPIRLPALLLMWNSITWITILLSLLLVCKLRQTNPLDLYLSLERISNM